MGNLLIGYANFAADQWATWVVIASLDAAVVLALACLVWLAIRKRVAPQVGYCLFLLVPLKLLVPVVVTVPATLAQWTPSVLISSWFEGAWVPERNERRPPVETQIAADGPVRSALPASTLEPPAADFDQPTRQAQPRTEGPIKVAADLSAHPVAEAPALSMPAGFLIAWLVGVVLLLVRLAATQRRFRARIWHLAPLDESKLAIDVRELCRRAGVSQTICLVEDDSAAVPAVWGIARPTIILPRGIASTLTAEQRRWILLHELAHVRRRDLIVLMLQRFAAILHFFNPAVWVANRVIDQLREYACDDLAVSLSDASGVESGEAFVRILQHADRGRRGLEGALGVFGLDSRAACFLRVRRLLDTERPIRTAPGRWSLWGLVLLAAISVPHLRAAGQATPDSPQAAATDVPAGTAREFELSVVGPDGKPIPNAVVELSADPLPTPDQIRKGKLIRQQMHGVVVATDAAGRIVVELPQAPERFGVFITNPGYGPYWTGWSSETHAEPIPPRFTAELEAAWSVGGVIVDAGGKPVEGVEVHPSIEFKKRPGDVRQFGSGARAKTDAAGKWHFDSVPVSMAEVHAEIDHPSFMPIRRSLTRGEFGIEPGREPATRIVLDRGLTVTGKVTDEAGKSIVGALVRTKFWNDIRQATTGSDGVYKLVGCEPKPVHLVVSADGRATDMKELNIEPGMGSVDFQMKPGRTVRVRVLDEQGNPVPRARIFFQQWRGRYQYFEFDLVNQYADDKGVWVWDEAPVDEFRADICPPGGMTLQRQPLIAREAEYVFRVPGPLVVSGKVIDAVTRQPIKTFRVVPGGRYEQGQMFWNRKDSFIAADGHYEIRRTWGDSANLIRIEADGYQAAVSRDIQSSEGTIAIDFELKPGKDVVAKIVTPGNIAAAEAKVALGGAGSQIHVKNGDIDDVSTFSARTVTDESGRFQFPAQDKDFQLVITHPAGFALVKSKAEWVARIIRLEPWSKVEGTFRVGKAPAANVSIEIVVPRLQSYGTDVPTIYTTHLASTGPEGRFVFERVIPGTGRIGRRLTFMVDEDATEVASAYMIGANFPSGKTVHIDLGGVGRPVVGKLHPPEGLTEKVRWNFADVTVVSGADGPYFTVTVDREGKFRIDDVPAGDYSLSVRFRRDNAGGLSNYRFSVPMLEGDAAGRPVDLGTLKLEKR
jgi:beta-lactamase regulating signal transducer with metallopeptidase domain